MLKVFHEAPNLAELREKGFVADMHYHTSHSHDCMTPVKDILRVARRLGVHVAITDHNRIGGVLEALKHKDAPVIPGIEICTREGKEVIAFFYEADHLQEFYEKRLTHFITAKNAMRSTRTHVPMAELLAMLKEEQCVVHMPHPFAPPPRWSHRFFERRPELMRHIDSIEVFNETMTRRANLLATGWAVESGKGAAGGSDGHSLGLLGKGVTLSAATTAEEHLNCVKRGSVSVYGRELKAFARMINFARNAGKSKLENGIKEGLTRLSFARL